MSRNAACGNNNSNNKHTDINESYCLYFVYLLMFNNDNFKIDFLSSFISQKDQLNKLFICLHLNALIQKIKNNVKQLIKPRLIHLYLSHLIRTFLLKNLYFTSIVRSRTTESSIIVHPLQRSQVITKSFRQVYTYETLVQETVNIENCPTFSVWNYELSIGSLFVGVEYVSLFLVLFFPNV